jgi:hypothetical protein
MFTSHRCTGVTRLGALLESHALVHARFRLDITCNRNVVSDERLWLRAFARKGHMHRSVLAIVFEGRAWLEHEGRRLPLDAGGMAILPNKVGVSVRREGARFLGAMLEWDPGTLGDRAPAARPMGHLSLPDLHALRALVEAVTARPRSDGEARELFVAILDALRGVGVPLDAPGATTLVEEEPQGPWEALRTALDRSLSDLHSRPMIVDLESALGASPRHIQRMVSSFHARYGFDAGGWRDALHRRRMLVGTALMTAPGATTEIVARAIGYGSPTAFCHAMAGANLPAPSAVPLVACEPAA